MTTDSIMKHWTAISLYRPRILPTLVKCVANVNANVNKFYEVNRSRVISLDVSTIVDPDPIDLLESYDEIETSFPFPMLKERVVVFICF